MPYIAIKCYPQKEEIKKKVVDGIHQLLLDNWGCPPEAISISIEEYAPGVWEKEVKEAIVDKMTEGVVVRDGVKHY